MLPSYLFYEQFITINIIFTNDQKKTRTVLATRHNSELHRLAIVIKAIK